MTVAIIAGVVGLAAVLVAFYRDPPVEEHRVRDPDWDLLPDPGDVARTEFPMAMPGYEPATVELHFDMLTRAYADLLACATPEVLARARHRAAVRRGIEPPGDGDPRGTPGRAAPRRAPRSTPASPSAQGEDDDALAAEAALADLDGKQSRSRP